MLESNISSNNNNIQDSNPSTPPISDEEKSHLLYNCYSLLENAISFLSSGPDEDELAEEEEAEASKKKNNKANNNNSNGSIDRWTDLPKPTLLKIQHIFSEVFFNILQYLKYCQENGKYNDSFAVGSMRVLGAWLAGETAQHRKEVNEILPFLLELKDTRYCMRELELISATFSAFPTSFTSFTTSSSNCYIHSLSRSSPNPVDPLIFLLPGLLNLTSEQDIRTTFLRSGGLAKIVQFVKENAIQLSHSLVVSTKTYS